MVARATARIGISSKTSESILAALSCLCRLSVREEVLSSMLSHAVGGVANGGALALRTKAAGEDVRIEVPTSIPVDSAVDASATEIAAAATPSLLEETPDGAAMPSARVLGLCNVFALESSAVTDDP